MQEAGASPLIAWENFYVIVGSSAAALTGLMFVVITLVAGVRVQRTGASGGQVTAFGTPNVVHFCVSLFVAALLTAPWPELWYVSLLQGICGLIGVVYVFIIFRRLPRYDYQPVLEDWVWHVVLPFICYVTLLIAAIMLLSNPVVALFCDGAATVLLLFIGIHNAWDTVTYVTLEYSRPENIDLE